MHWSVCWVAVVLVLAGCDLAGTSAQAGQAGVENRVRKAEATPEIVAKAEQILKQHPDAKIGEEFRFRSKGKRYVARVEEHDNAAGEPGRPPGKHKGITVYVAE